MLIIRKAREEDAKGILEVHYAAVHGDPVDFYEEEVLDDWSPSVDDQRLANFLSRPQLEDEVVRVAEMDNTVVGFAIIVPKLSELRALYVHPRITRQGIGQALLQEVERTALLVGLDWINLKSALNAEPFYLANGYVADGLGKQPLPGGRDMSCVRMYKFLTSETTKWSRGIVP